MPAPGASLGSDLKLNKLASERRRYVCVKTSPFRGYFIPQTGAADRNPPLHWGLSVCYGQEEHVLFALLDEDILAVEEHIFGGHGVGRVDADPVRILPGGG